MDETGRRGFVRGVALIGGATLIGCARKEGEEHEEEITPGEDLMREHGVLERVLVVWNEAEGPLRRGESVEVGALRESVELVRRFVERYHEKLEEDFVFPRLERAGRERALVRTLRDQHRVGRAITAEVARLLDTRLDGAARGTIADRLMAYSRMYLAHASREDTIVFPAFREIVGRRYAELGEEFEEREHRIVGEGGFEHAVAQVARIEEAFGIADLARLTPRTRSA
jgi:hemerythrin-like domain-containing protein